MCHVPLILEARNTGTELLLQVSFRSCCFTFNSLISNSFLVMSSKVIFVSIRSIYSDVGGKIHSLYVHKNIFSFLAEMY
jgi:hypothetical protein